MTAFIWFWVIVGLLIVLGVVFWIVFARSGPRKRKSNELDEMLFRK